MTEHFKIDETALEQTVLEERIRQFMVGERINAISGPFAASLFLIYLLHGYVENSQLLTWWLLMLAADGASIIWTSIYLKSPNIKNHKKWMNTQVFLQGIAGFVWGFSVFLFHLENSPITQMYNYTVLTAVSGLTAVSLLPVYKAYFTFSLTTWAFPVIYFLYLGDKVHFNFALGVIVLLIVLNLFGYNASKQLEKGVFERFRSAQLADFLSAAIKKIEVMAKVDELTRIYNRRYGLEQLEKEHGRQKRYGDDLSIIIFDIDKFKNINDTHGHTAGDRVLQHICRLAQSTLRKQDILCRYGGEEFLIILPQTSVIKAEQIAERVRRHFKKNQMTFNSSPIPATASFGVAAVSANNQLVSQIDEADKALYEAKNSGRNKVCVSSLSDT